MNNRWTKALPVLWVICALVAGAPIALASSESGLRFESGEKPVQLLELYTSQGCSSCPPAERWLSQWQQHKRLWHDLIPVAFHVDYWDWIGWQDPYATADHSLRQRNYKQQRAIKSVYTPGFVVDGKEWRGWFDNARLPAPGKKQGKLSAQFDGSSLALNYRSGTDIKKIYNAHVVVLGFDLQTAVKRGENSNRVLTEDFVVLWYKQKALEQKLQLSLPGKNGLATQKLAVAIWVTEANSTKPLQAVGGWW